jgi:hypothetical protein
MISRTVFCAECLKFGRSGRSGSDPAATAMEWLSVIGQAIRLNGGFLIPHPAVVVLERPLRPRGKRKDPNPPLHVSSMEVSLSCCRLANYGFFITCPATGKASTLIPILGTILIPVISSPVPRKTSADSYVKALPVMPYRQANGHCMWCPTARVTDRWTAIHQRGRILRKRIDMRGRGRPCKTPDDGK